MITCATMRQALFSVAKMGDPLMYCGLPRTVSGYGGMAYVLSHFFFGMNPARYLVGAFLVTRLLAAQPAAHPVHDAPGKAEDAAPRPAAGPLGFLVTVLAAVFFARNYVFDVLFFWMLGYAALRDGSRFIPRRSAPFMPATGRGPARSRARDSERAKLEHSARLRVRMAYDKVRGPMSLTSLPVAAPARKPRATFELLAGGKVAFRAS